MYFIVYIHTSRKLKEFMHSKLFDKEKGSCNALKWPLLRVL